MFRNKVEKLESTAYRRDETYIGTDLRLKIKNKITAITQY